jgi:sarcosine oxidase subunit alpha
MPNRTSKGETHMPLRLNANVERGRAVHIIVDGARIQAYEGESVAAAMLAAGIYVFRHTHPDGQPRGIFCGMGVCYECLVKVEGRERVRACIFPVEDGMRITTAMEQEQLGA